MGLKIFGVSETLMELRRTEKRTNKRLLRHLRNSAKDIRDLAREYAPIDQGNLEEAIEIVEIRGIAHRQVEFIGVNPDKLGEGYSKYGERYDVLMHEGVYELGDRSKAKAASSGQLVGPKYLTRAWQKLEPDITTVAEAIVRDTLRTA